MVTIPFAALVVLMPEDISFSPGIVTYTKKKRLVDNVHTLRLKLLQLVFC